VKLKAKVIIRIPAAQANTSINEILREHGRLLAEELRSVRIEKFLERVRPSSSVLERLRWWDHNI
jgi:hypothetical protein